MRKGTGETTSNNRETEIKLKVPDAATGRRLLRANGFRLLHRRMLETNTLYDTAGYTMRSSRRLLRIRRFGSASILTFKGSPEPGKHKSREELEVTVSDAVNMSEILARLGFQATFRYEKFRSEYRGGDHQGVVTLDETPIGTYLELEGPPEWIDATAAALGFGEKDYITLSYGGLWAEHCRARRIPEGDMVFQS